MLKYRSILEHLTNTPVELAINHHSIAENIVMEILERAAMNISSNIQQVEQSDEWSMDTNEPGIATSLQHDVKSSMNIINSNTNNKSKN